MARIDDEWAELKPIAIVPRVAYWIYDHYTNRWEVCDPLKYSIALKLADNAANVNCEGLLVARVDQ